MFVKSIHTHLQCYRESVGVSQVHVMFLITFFFCSWKNIREQPTKNRWQKIHLFKTDKNIMKVDIPVLQRQVENGKVKGDTVTKVPQLAATLIFNLKIEKFPQCIQQPTEEKGKNRVHKQGIKLPLYKNRSFSKCFFSSFFFLLQHFTVYATKKAVIVSQAQFFLITLFEHTIAKQHIHFGGVKVLTFLFSFFYFFFFFALS